MSVIIPTPKKYDISDKTEYQINPSVFSHFDNLQNAADVFRSMFAKIYEYSLSNEPGGIELFCEPELPSGAYRLVCDGKVKLYASDYEGAMHALTSALQIISFRKGKLYAASMQIEDHADKGYRALMVDLGRQWHPFDKLFKYVDICCMCKVKYLHLHFVDNLLYTLPSEAFPKLSVTGRHYTRAQLKELDGYAKARGVVIVPEFEGPGHAEKLVEVYPEIFANKITRQTEEKTYTEAGAVIDETGLVCAGSSDARQAMKDILSEIFEIFPDSPYINLGCDEANIKLWNYCSCCQKYMNENNLADEHELYADYIADMANYCLENGKTPIVWEGFSNKISDKIPKETIVIGWESYYHMPDELTDEGFDVINASWQPLYIVPGGTERWNPTDILKWNVYNWQHWWPNSKACLNPINVTPTDRVKGAMLCAWEMTYEQEINFVMENLCALSERTWNVQRVCDDKTYMTKQKNMQRLISLLIKD